MIEKSITNEEPYMKAQKLKLNYTYFIRLYMKENKREYI